MSDETPASLVRLDPAPLAAAGAAANHAAARGVFTDYRSRKAAGTRRAQDADLGRWAQYLADVGATSCPGWADDPECWRGVSWGLVEAFVRWQQARGYTVASINRALSTVKTYAKLATKAGALDPQAYTLIRAVAGYGRTEGRRMDEGRAQTRMSGKKATAVLLALDQVRALKAQPDTPQGRRDALLICLLADHGLRVGEVALLRVEHFDRRAGTFTFYRPKVDKIQTHKMTADTARALGAYLDQDGPALPAGPLLQGSKKGGALAGEMTERAINARVGVLGERIGVKGLSPHDLRHYWATDAARNGTPIDRLQDAGGWSSPAMPLHYVEAAAIANEGVRRSE